MVTARFNEACDESLAVRVSEHTQIQHACRYGMSGGAYKRHLEHSRRATRTRVFRSSSSSWPLSHLEKLVIDIVGSPFRVRDVDHSLQVFAELHCRARVLVRREAIRSFTIWSIFVRKIDRPPQRPHVQRRANLLDPIMTLGYQYVSFVKTKLYSSRSWNPQKQGVVLCP